MIIAMLIVVLGLLTLLTVRSDRKAPEQVAERKTALALAQAKEALLGYAATDANHPGSLPCPDANDDGTSDIYDYSGKYCKVPVGRLPWRLLRLPDLRDGSGERLWYAVSPDFSANSGTMLNSTFSGQITTRDAGGVIINNASVGAGVIAVIIAPGAVLVRQGAASPQDRSCIVVNTIACDAQLVCNSPFISVPKCNPINYLDLTGSEDNQNFVEGATDGFIAGVIKDASENTIVNDRMNIIATRELLNVVTQRMVREFVKKLDIYNPYPPVNPYPIPPPPPPAPPPPLDVWDKNGWNNAAVYTYQSANQFTLQFANCSSVFTVTRGASSTTISRSGNC